MTPRRQRLHDELVRRQDATTTRASDLRIIQAFHRHAGGRLARLGPDDLRRDQIYLLKERKLAVGTVIAEIAALRFFYLRVLKRRDMKKDLPYPKRRRRLPVVLSPEEVQRLIAGAKNPYHRTLLLTLYGTGLRRSELCHLQVRHIDSPRMVVRVERGKGGVDREVPLSPTLLTALRAYYRWMRPQTHPVTAPPAGGAQSAGADPGPDARGPATVTHQAEAGAAVTRPALEVADVLHAQGDTFVAQHPWLSVQQRSVLRAITRCRTAALGGHRGRCDACGHQAVSYNSCLYESLSER